MIRGTTAQFKFNLPYNFDQERTIKITFWQNGNPGTPEAPLPIIKYTNHCIRSNENPREISVILDQSETLRFSDKRKAFVQLRGQSTDGTIFGNKPVPITVYPLCEDDILPNSTPPSSEHEGWLIIDGGDITDLSEDYTVIRDAEEIGGEE